jgi:hypothetical protein
MIAFGLSAMGLVIHIVYIYGSHWGSCIFGKQTHFAHEEETEEVAKEKHSKKMKAKHKKMLQGGISVKRTAKCVV